MAERRKSFNNRPAVIKRLRARDGENCWLCQTRILFMPKRAEILGIATIDHILPVSLGGSNDNENLRLAHLLCNTVRGDCINVDEIKARIATLFDGEGNPNPRSVRRKLLAAVMGQTPPPEKIIIYPFCAWPRAHLSAWPVVDAHGNVTLAATKPDHLK